MRALFESRNLVGDSLCVSAALQAWHKEHPEYEIDLLTDDNAVAELYKGMGVPLNVIFKQKEMPSIAYDFEFNFDVNKAFQICDQKKCHLAQGYADLLGVALGDLATDLGPFYDPPLVKEDDEWVSKMPQDTVLLAPFSRSCASHDGKPPNKCVPWVKWKPIIRFLRSLGKPIRITGSANERADELGFSEEEYLTGMPLRALARAMKEKKVYLLVSVDNGISHLAGSQKVPHLLYYPMCLGLHYAVPWSNPMVIPIQNDPAMVEPAQLVWSTKQAFNMLENMRKEGPDGPLNQSVETVKPSIHVVQKNPYEGEDEDAI
jgi:ADP-heptose:LPS heptosyltransferase